MKFTKHDLCIETLIDMHHRKTLLQRMMDGLDISGIIPDNMWSIATSQQAGARDTIDFIIT